MISSMQVFRKDDGPVLNPKKYFSESDLEKIAPYEIFTGEGFMVTISIPHECDCEYCDHEDEEETICFRTKAELDKKLAEIKDDDDCELLKVEPGFYARVVHQYKTELI